MYEKKVNTLTPTSVLVTVAHCKTYDEPVEAVVDDAYAWLAMMDPQPVAEVGVVGVVAVEAGAASLVGVFLLGHLFLNPLGEASALVFEF